MKNLWKRVISVMLGLMMSAPGISARASAPENTGNVQVWRRTDIVLQSEKEYDNPYKDVDIDAVPPARFAIIDRFTALAKNSTPWSFLNASRPHWGRQERSLLGWRRWRR